MREIFANAKHARYKNWREKRGTQICYLWKSARDKVLHSFLRQI
jgi:transcription initiation factor IIE alpha subunit